jgi:hypothetical protein
VEERETGRRGREEDVEERETGRRAGGKMRKKKRQKEETGKRGRLVRGGD